MVVTSKNQGSQQLLVSLRNPKKKDMSKQPVYTERSRPVLLIYVMQRERKVQMPNSVAEIRHHENMPI